MGEGTSGMAPIESPRKVETAIPYNGLPAADTPIQVEEQQQQEEIKAPPANEEAKGAESCNRVRGLT